MNKLAAEKIAQEYYQIGQVLALESMGMTKEANMKKKILAALGLAGAGTGLGLGVKNLLSSAGKKLTPLSEVGINMSKVHPAEEILQSVGTAGGMSVPLPEVGPMSHVINQKAPSLSIPVLEDLLQVAKAKAGAS